MNDFRTVLYSSYVSGFKSEISPYTESEITATKKAYKYHFFPLLQSLPRSAKILDMGCGPGFFLEALKEWGFTGCTGIDASEEQAAIGNKRGNPVVCGDVLKHIGETTGEYDCIIALDFIEHFTKDELVAAFSNVHKALKKGGIFLIQTPNGEAIHPGRLTCGDFTHLTIFSAPSFKQLAKATGFTSADVYEKHIQVTDAKTFVMKLLWNVQRAVVWFFRSLEETTAKKIMTANLIGKAVK